MDLGKESDTQDHPDEDSPSTSRSERGRNLSESSDSGSKRFGCNYYLI